MRESEACALARQNENIFSNLIIANQSDRTILLQQNDTIEGRAPSFAAKWTH
jgi:hypothetical protein